MAGIDSGAIFSETTTHATSAVASHAGVAGKSFYVTDIAGSSDKAGSLLLVKQGTTVIWQVQLATTAVGTNAFNHSFKVPLKGASGALVSVTVDGTSVANANIAGYEL